MTESAETIRTFWHGGVPSPYQLLSFKSFADRGCRVEVFSYDPSVHLPRWIARRDAAEVLPAERVLRFLPAHGRFAVNVDLFRYALLAKFGGWWVDPDVVLLADGLPSHEIFLARADEFGMLSTAALRFPPQHPVMLIAEEFAAANASETGNWQNAAAPYLTALAERHGLSSLCQGATTAVPVPRSDVAALFDPSQDERLAAQVGEATFLDLHYDVWLQAGVPVISGPPVGSLLHRLLQRHDVGDVGDGTRMNYGNLVQLLPRLS
jgi:hypothetical protein